MRILTLNHYESDFCADGLLQGLHYVAADNGWTVAELPIIQHVHGGIDQGYVLADGKLGFTGPTQDTIRNAPPLPTMREEETLERWADFDLIVMTSLRAYARDALRKICAVSGKHPKDLPLVVCDGDDTEYIDYSYLNEIKPKVFFKRELLRNGTFDPYSNRLGIPIWPLQFAAHYRNLDPTFNDEEKFVDIFCSLGRTHPTRDILIAELLRAIPIVGCSHHVASSNPEMIDDPHGLLKGRLDWEGYMRLKAGAEISFSVRGWGRDTLHYWEGFMGGAAMMVADPGLVIPYPFSPHDHYIPIEPPYTDVAGLISLYLNIKPELLIKKRRAAKAHCLKYHTTEARATYLVDIAQRYIYGNNPPETEEFGL